MKLSMMQQMLGTLDPNIVYVCIGVLAIGVILALVKKALWIAFVLVVLGMASYMIVPIAKDFQKNYYIGINDDKQLEIRVDGKEFKFGGEENGIKEINMERQQSGEYVLQIKYNDGGIATFTTPGYMRSTIIKYLKDNELNYKLWE